MELCSCDGAQRKINGLTPVNKDVVTTVFDLLRWRMTDQIIRICKPLVDIIGDVESQDSTLADCMLQLIWAHCAVINSPLMEGDDPAFADHTKNMLNVNFHAMNTDVHWLALFLHPLCRKLAVSTARHSQKLVDAYRISLDIVQRWKWSKEMAENLTWDLKAYHNSEAPFKGGKSDGKDWWKSLVIHILSKPSQSSSFPSFHMQPKSSDSFQTLVASNQLNGPISQSLTCKHSGPFEITMFDNCTRLPSQLGNLLGASMHICICQLKEVELTLAMLMNFSKMFFGPPNYLPNRTVQILLKPPLLNLLPGRLMLNLTSFLHR